MKSQFRVLTEDRLLFRVLLKGPAASHSTTEESSSDEHEHFIQPLNYDKTCVTEDVF